MAYFVTGASGFVGRYLVKELLARNAPIFVLVRRGAEARLDELRAWWGRAGDQVIAIAGDLTLPGLGISTSDRERLRGKIDHLFHLGAVYDLEASAKSLADANVAGTRNALDFAADVGATLPSLQLDRRRRPLSAVCSPRICSRRPAGSIIPTSVPSTMPRRSCAASHACRGASIVRHGRRRLAYRTHHEGRRSVSLLQGAADPAAPPAGLVARPSASRAVTSTSCRSTTWLRRWCICRDLSGQDGRCFHLTDPAGAIARVRCSTCCEGGACTV